MRRQKRRRRWRRPRYGATRLTGFARSQRAGETAMTLSHKPPSYVEQVTSPALGSVAETVAP